jgi:RPA family protein
MAQRREPGVLVLAKELSFAIEKHVEDREYSPTYLISEIGAKLSRVLVGGVLDQIENRGSEEDPFYTARVIDPNGDYYYLQAGQYNPEGAAALSKLEIGVPVLCVGKVRARTPEDSERTYVSVQPENIRAVSMDEVNHWAIKACDQLMRRINANKAYGNDDKALKRANLTVREMDGLELSKNFYPTVVVENYAALLYDCLTRLAGGEVSMPETKNFTGEFEPAGSATESEDNTQETEEKVEEVSEKSDADDNETKVMKLIKEDEGDGIYYDDLAIKISAEGIDNPMLDEVLDSLTDQGLVFQPRFNHYKEA